MIRKLVIFLSVLLVLTPASASALSQEQLNIYNSGIYYFDADQTAQTATGCADLPPGTLPGSVPAPYNSIFSAAGAKFNVPPAFLAALFYAGEHGSSWPTPPAPYGNGSPWGDSHVTGSNPDWPPGTPGTRPIGARGPFQFEYPAWTDNGVDGNGDGTTDVEDLTDAAFGAANMLAHLGANTTDTQKLHDAASHYNGTGSQAEAYADKVMAAYQQFSGGQSGSTTDTSQTDTDATDTGSADTSSCSVSTNLGPVSIQTINAFGAGDGLMGHQPTMVGLHYTAGNEQSVQDVINDLQDPTGSKDCNHVTHTCSVQLTVLPDGSVYQLTSRLDVITENIINFNDADIGIEIVGRDEQTLLANQKQFDAVVALVAQLMQNYNIKMEQDFLNKAGLMGHMECDNWSQAHLGANFSGQYNGETVNSTDSHQDPGATYMAKVRAALQPAQTQ